MLEVAPNLNQVQKSPVVLEVPRKKNLTLSMACSEKTAMPPTLVLAREIMVI
jgi:hypothetical protein